MLVGGTGVLVGGVVVLVEGTEVFVGVAILVALGVCDGFGVGATFAELSLPQRCGSRCGQAASALLDKLSAVKTMSGRATRLKPSGFTRHL